MLSEGRERRRYYIPRSSCQSVFSDQYVFFFLVAYPQLLWTHREISVQVIDSVLFIPVLPGKSAYFDFNLFSIFFNYKVSLDSDYLGLSIPPCVSGALNPLQTYGVTAAYHFSSWWQCWLGASSPLGEDGMSSIVYSPQLSALTPREDIFSRVWKRWALLLEPRASIVAAEVVLVPHAQKSKSAEVLVWKKVLPCHSVFSFFFLSVVYS